MNTTMTGAAATYLAQVKAELSDLPASELEEVLDDVADHLEEISAELDGEPTMPGLEARIGSPQQYAEELRSAAGYPPKSPGLARSGKHPGTGPLRWGIAGVVVTPLLILIWLGTGLVWSPVATLFFLALLVLCPALGIRALRGQDPRIVTTSPRWQRGEAWLRARADRLPATIRRDLVTIGQPVWWVARGVAGGVLVIVALGAGGPIAVLAGLFGAVASVWVARRSQRDRRWMWFVVPANVLGAIAVLVALVGLGTWSTSYAFNGRDGYGPSTGYGSSGLTHDGRPVANVFPFDQQGKPLKDVRLYDEEGRPLTVSLERCPVPPDYATLPSEQDNVFPNLTVTYSDWDGSCRESMGPTFVVPPLPGQSTSTPAPSKPTKPNPPVPTGTR